MLQLYIATLSMILRHSSGSVRFLLVMMHLASDLHLLCLDRREKLSWLHHLSATSVIFHTNKVTILKFDSFSTILQLVLVHLVVLNVHSG